MRHLRTICAALALTGLPVMALAHGDSFDGDHLIAIWRFDPFILGLAGLALWCFAAGVLRRARGGREVGPWRQLAFPAGVILTVAALQSPFDAMADHAFWAHQIQHMILRVTGPLLMMAAAPQAVIIAGMPRALRGRLIAPIGRSGAMQALGRRISGPLVATAIFVAALYVWEIPALHDAALLNEALHYLMHVTMLLSGLLFFWIVFDRRDPPAAAPHGARMLMLAAAGLSQIAIGALTTLKGSIYYPAYDMVGRLWHIAPLTDEATGGFLIWAPTCMMYLLAVFVVVHRWNGAEERFWRREGMRRRSNSMALMMPETAEELWLAVAAQNRRIGLSLGAIPILLVLSVFALVETVRVLSGG